jgi:hypothetical protein
MMSKLHELIAVEKDLKGKMSKLIAETAKTFSDRRDHFEGMTRTYDRIDANDPEHYDPEVKELVTTVAKKLNYFEEQLVSVMDVILQKETANCSAVADLIVEDATGASSVLAPSVPVTVLVQLENIFESLRGSVYNNIPTLDPTKSWTFDAQSDGIFVNIDAKKNKTRKVSEPIVLYQATKEHPAQTQMVTVDRVVGYWNQKNLSGMITPKDKSKILDKVDRLLQGIKRARARANEIQVSNEKIGKALFNFLN